MRISAHSVCTAIRDEIIAGALPPGSRLTEDLLARRYGVSRVPVREALRTLDSEGFVTIRPHAGAFVAELTSREAADLLDVRLLLEPLGAARAAHRRTEAHLRVLRGLVRLGRRRVAQGHLSDLRQLGEWFQETLTQAADSKGLADLLTQLRRKVAWLYAVEPAARATDWQERGALVDAVARGDAERARALAAREAEHSAAFHRLRRAAPLRPEGV
ncbi:GntR family transcriptional regulator [Streptomyces xiaopingdaonensis]|uniref:GntR family transcriptional regulator n=1 Tax=Streptomyces xiaopingdaonensis TaxID=1565415 RepID=UPI0002DDB92C|nr:GntR family transcriptional regulator [Streptomyces xiaopingdaonensis]